MKTENNEIFVEVNKEIFGEEAIKKL